MRMKVQAVAAFLFCAFSALLAFFLFVRYLLPILLPFFIAYLLALATKGLANKLHRKTRIPASFLRVFLLAFLLLLSFGLLFWVAFRLVGEAQALLVRFGSGTSEFERVLSSLCTSFYELADRFGWGEPLTELFDSLLNKGTAVAVDILSGIIGHTLFALPRALGFLLVTLIAALYFALDLQRVSTCLTELIPIGYRARVSIAVAVLKNCLRRYARAYMLLMSLTFFALLIGFLCIGIKYAFLTALLLAMLDLLPVIGVGCVLAPWGIFLIAVGEGGRGFALLLLFALMFSARQIFEPKIVGTQMGLHPLVSLFFTYAGLRFFGIVGMVSAPIFAAIIHELLSERSQNRGIKKRR